MSSVSGNLVPEPLGRDNGNLIANPLVGLEVQRQLGVVTLNDDLGGLLDGLSSDATHFGDLLCELGKEVVVGRGGGCRVCGIVAEERVGRMGSIFRQECAWWSVHGGLVRIWHDDCATFPHTNRAVSHHILQYSTQGRVMVRYSYFAHMDIGHSIDVANFECGKKKLIQFAR